MKTVIDLFCGAGGTTTGVHLSGKAKVIACINHDPVAIRSHAANHPDCKHYIEDIRLFDEKLLPKCDFITMSAECTHFSIAKGGESRDADSRTLSEELIRYALHCEPTYIIVENVKEFLSWSELVHKTDKKGNLVFKPNGQPYLVPNVDKNQHGVLYRQWVKSIKAMGYEYKYKILNSADFGAYTSRERYFGIFAKKGNPIKFPPPTHAKNGSKYTLPKWNAVRKLLDMENKGTSIFGRKKPLCENTLKRIYAGLQKFVPNQQNSWIVKFLSNNPNTGVNSGNSIDMPLATITTQNRLGVASIAFIDSYKTNHVPTSLYYPLPTITTQGNKSLVSVSVFIDEYYGKGKAKSIDKPCPTIPTVGRFSLVSCESCEQDYTNYAYNGSQDDSQYTRLIKDFMHQNGIEDIKMRMLTVQELKKIQGFPEDYVLLGSETQQRKFIGNSVVPIVIQKIIENLYPN